MTEESAYACTSPGLPACTAIRWMIADLAGEDREEFYTTVGPQQTRLMTVHGPRERWTRTPQLFRLTAAERAEISPDNGWLVFTMIRDPWSRLWSAWQSKLLVRHSYYEKRFRDEEWFPRLPEKPADVVEDFSRFVDLHPWTWHEGLVEDRHFQPQLGAVQPHGISYSRIYDLAHFSEMVADVRAHLDAVGRPSELYLPRANDTPLPLTREAVSGGVAERIEELYGDDFAEWGDRWDLDRLVRAPDGWSDDALGSIRAQAAANQRIGDLVDVARSHEREARRAEAEVARTRALLEAERTRRLRSRVREAVAHRARRLVRRGDA